MASRWYVERDGASSPAVSFDRLAERWAAGELFETDRVRSESGDDWITLDDIVGLRKIATSRPPKSPASNAGVGQDLKTRAFGPATEKPHGGIETESSDAPAGQTAPSTLWQVTVPFKVLIPGSLLLAAASWMMWRSWYESRRFPRPLHDRADPGWNLPWIGPVSTLEAGLIAFDCVLLIVIAIFWHRRRGS
jgi:hypothetical protein